MEITVRTRVLAIAIFLTVLFAVITSSTPLLSQQGLDNTAIVKMVKAGLSADIVVATVNSQPGHYDVSADGLIALKKAGISDLIISAMIARTNSTQAPAPATPGMPATAGAPPAFGVGANGLPPGVDSVGLYYKDSTGNWSEVGAEVVNFKTGGALKHIGSVGIVKGDLNGNVSGFHSHLELKGATDFIIYTPEGTSPGEYQLIRFRVDSQSREFRALTGGVAHTAGGAARDTVDFTSKKIAPRVYQVTAGGDLGKGEFGFQPPHEMQGGKSVSSSGKIYTFTLGD
jgi:hypothetical protein